MPKRVARSGPKDKPGKPAPSRRKRRSAARSGEAPHSIPVERYLEVSVRDLYVGAMPESWRAVLGDLMGRGFQWEYLGEVSLDLFAHVVQKQGYRVSIEHAGRGR